MKYMLKSPSFIFFAILSSLFFSCSYSSLSEGLYAEIVTTKGTVVAKLDYENTPLATINFLGLGTGNKEYYVQVINNDEAKTEVKKDAFYPDTYFTVAEAGFIVQGGDPIGDGTGSPGYIFDDEIIEDSFNVEGVLAMANDGPNTNGSQFFITLDILPELNNRYTAFGQVVIGMDIAQSIEVGDQVISMKAIAKGRNAKAFKISQEHFDEIIAENDLRREQEKEKIQQELLERYPQLESLPSGILYEYTQKGTGAAVSLGDNVEVLYTISLLDDTLIESTNNTNAPLNNGNQAFSFLVGSAKVPSAFNQIIQIQKEGDDVLAYVPPSEAYKQRGYSSNEIQLPPYSWLKIEISVLSVEKIHEK